MRPGAAAPPRPAGWRPSWAVFAGAALGAALLLAAGCGGPTAEAPPPAPVTPRATTILEPPVLEVGDTAVVEVAVATPPGVEVHAPDPPSSVPGLWLLGAEVPRVEREASRWVHRARFRVRARETGRFTWPALALELSDVDGEGEPRTLEAPARPFEVVSLLGEDEGPPDPLRYRTPALDGDGGRGWAALAGAAAALAAVGLVLLVRRVRAAERGPGAASGASALPGLAAPWRAARATLEAAEARAEQDPVQAAHLAASALRVLASRRLGSQILAQTTDELAARPPPATLETAWGELLELLRALDAVRFAPPVERRDPEALEALWARGRAVADRLGSRSAGR